MGMKLLVMQVTRQVSHCESLYTPQEEKLKETTF